MLKNPKRTSGNLKSKPKNKQEKIKEKEDMFQGTYILLIKKRD